MKAFLHYRFGGLIFGGAYTWRGLFSEFYGMLLCEKESTEDSIEQSQLQPSTQRPIKKSKTVKRKLRPSPFFFRLATNAFPDVGPVGRIGKRKTKKEKKNHKKSRNRRPWYPRMTLKVNIHITGLTKCTIYCKKRSCFCSCFFSMLLLCSFFRLKELF